MKTKWAQVFGESDPVFVSGVVASVHPDLSEEAIDELVANYDASKHEAPITVGHPKDNSPAYGWVSKLVKKGTDLIAEMVLLPEFAELVKKQVYKKRSIAFYTDFENTGKRVLRHIGFLGGMPPRIKGMPDLVFGELQEQFTEIEGEYSDLDMLSDIEQRAIGEITWKLKDLAIVLRNLKNNLIEEKGAEAADKIIDEYFLKNLARDIDMNPPESRDGGLIYTENTGNKEDELNYTQEQVDKLLADAKAETVKEFSEKLTAATDKIKTMETEAIALKSTVKEFADKATKVEVVSFCEAQIKEARMAPAEKDGFVELYMELTDDARAKLKANIEKRPKVLTFGEQATDGKEQQPDKKGLTEADKLFGVTEKDLEKYADQTEYRLIK
jgi:hypothetical protein